MSPDSALGALAQRLARIEQRVDDLMERIVEKFAVVAEDIRIFGPLVREHDEMRAEMRFVRESVVGILARQTALEKRMDDEREERIKGQAERKNELEAAREERNLEIARIEADRRKQADEFRARADAQRAESRKLFYGVVGIFITAAFGLVAQLLGSGGGM